MRNATVEPTVALSAWPQPHMERQFNSRSITYEQIFFLVSGILKRCSLWKSLFVNAELWVCGLHGLNKPPGMQLNRTVTF